jgi:hypothetical protein
LPFAIASAISGDRERRPSRRAQKRSRMAQEILCLIAGQRSGTTALRDLIAGTGAFADLAEIFDTATIDQPTAYFNYCRERALKITDILSGPDAERLCKDYISVLRATADDRHVLIDVKFNSWGEIRMPWTYMHQEPFFLSQLKWMRAKFIFVWRRDIVAQVLSDRISDHIGKWHNLDASDSKERFVLNKDKIRTRAKLLCQSEQYFYRNMKEYDNCVFLSYEEIFDRDGRLAPDARDRIAGLMNETYVFPDSGAYRRNRIVKSEVVENYAELASIITDVAAQFREPDLAIAD